MAVKEFQMTGNELHSKPQSGKAQRYKKIRFKTFDPKKKSSSHQAGQFLHWQPTAPEGCQREGGQTASPPRSCDDDDSTIECGSERSISPLQQLPSNGFRVNPFLVYPIKPTESLQSTLDYFIAIMSGVDGEDNMALSTNPHIRLLLPFALQHAELFEAIIAVCRASVLLAIGRPVQDDSAFIKFRGGALASLGQKLRSKDCTDDSALLTVTMMLTLEYLIGNYDGVRMHIKGLDRMLELRGEIPQPENSDPNAEWTKFVKGGLVAYKALGDFVTGAAPQIPPTSQGYIKETFEELELDQNLAYPSPPYSPQLCTILSRLPAGLSDICLTTLISTQVINLLHSISGTITMFDYPASPKSTPLPDLVPQECASEEDERRQHTIQPLLSSLQRISLMSPTPIEMYLCSGLVAYLFQLRRLSPLNLFYDPVLRKFIDALICHPKPLSRAEQHCLIWTCMAVAGVLDLRAVPMAEAYKVLERALDLYPVARDWSTLEKVLRSFFWTEEIGAHWQKVWEAASKRRDFILRREGQRHPEVAPPIPDLLTVQEMMREAPREMRSFVAAMGFDAAKPKPQSNSQSPMVRTPNNQTSSNGKVGELAVRLAPGKCPFTSQSASLESPSTESQDLVGMVKKCPFTGQRSLQIDLTSEFPGTASSQRKCPFTGQLAPSDSRIESFQGDLAIGLMPFTPNMT